MGPEFAREGETQSWLWRDLGYRLIFSRFTERFGQMHAELTVESMKLDANGRAGHVHWSSLCLASVNERESIARKLARQDSSVQWAEVIELSCCWAARIERAGDAIVDLSQGKQETRPREFLLRGLLPLGETSLIYGDGASGKSLLAQAVALACRLGRDLPGGLRAEQAVPVVYYDWETNQQVIRRRMARLSSGWQLPIPQVHYVSMRRGLLEDIGRVRADVDRVRAGLVVIDSVGFASSAASLNDAEAATRMFNALRGLKTTILGVHHLSKVASDVSTGPTKPYGSSYFYNSCRNAWEVRSHQEADDLTMSLWHRKDNDGVLRKRPIGLRFAFQRDDGPITLCAADIEADKVLIGHGGLAFHIKSLLRSGAMTIAELAEETGQHKDTIARTLRRMPDVTKLPGSETGRGKVTTWGLLQRE